MTEPAPREPELSDRDRTLLVGLADGTLRGRHRARAEELIRARPDAARLLERQRRVRDVLGDGPAPVPPPDLNAAPAPARAERAPWWLPRAVAVAGVAAVAAAVALVLPGPDDRSAVAQAADQSRKPPTSPAPASAGPVLRASVDGVRFPDWSHEFGWREIGSRRDTIGGRAAKTVFYEHQGHRLAYTILPGPAAKPPAGAEVVRRNGVKISLSRDPGHGGHEIAVFQRDGRTCVVAGHVKKTSTLIKLAAWTGGGAVRS